MLVYNVNFQIMFSFFVKSHISHWKHLQDTIDTEFKLPCLFLMWTFTSYFQFDMKSHVSQLKFELSDNIPLWSHQSPHWKHLKNTLDTRFKVLCLFIMWTSRLCFFVKSHGSHWKHLQDTLDTEFNLPCLFLMWPFRSYLQFDMKAHVSQLKCDLSDYILFLMWSHHTGNTWKILWIQDLNFHACF